MCVELSTAIYKEVLILVCTVYMCCQCIDAAHLMEEVGVTDSRGVEASSVPLLAAALVHHLRQGHCVRRRNLPLPAFFTDYIFQSLNRTSDLHVMGNYKHQVHAYKNTVCICIEDRCYLRFIQICNSCYIKLVLVELVNHRTGQ